MKTKHPRFFLSTLALCAFAMPALTFAETSSIRTGGLMKGDRVDSEASRQINKSKSNVKNNRSEGSEPAAGEARELDGTPGKPPVVIDVKRPVAKGSDLNTGQSPNKGINQSGIK